MKLNESLSKNRNLLCPNCKNLGRSKGSFLWRRKILLSHTTKSGWKIRQLNLVQLFLRNQFGAYQSTHLNHVATKIGAIKITSRNEACISRIQSLWAKKNIIGLGNANLSNATVICFPEDHTDIAYQANTCRFINAHYQSGDIILIEGKKAGDSLDFCPDKLRNLKKGSVIQGWEPEDLKIDAFEKHNLIEDEILKPMKDIVGLICNPIELEQKLPVLMLKIDEWKESYQSESKLVLNAEKILSSTFEHFKDGSLCNFYKMNYFEELNGTLKEYLELKAESIYMEGLKKFSDDLGPHLYCKIICTILIEFLEEHGNIKYRKKGFVFS